MNLLRTVILSTVNHAVAFHQKLVTLSAYMAKWLTRASHFINTCNFFIVAPDKLYADVSRIFSSVNFIL